MKNAKNVLFLMVSILFVSYTATAQVVEEEEEETIEETSTITGIYKGLEDGMYTFSFTDEDDEESTINFEKISPEAKKMVDLSNKKMIGQLFTMTFSNVNEEEEDFSYRSVKTILTIDKAKE